MDQDDEAMDEMIIFKTAQKRKEWLCLTVSSNGSGIERVALDTPGANGKEGLTKVMVSLGSFDASITWRSCKISSWIAAGSREGERTFPAPPRPVWVICQKKRY